MEGKIFNILFSLHLKMEAIETCDRRRRKGIKKPPKSSKLLGGLQIR
jgi:hypothetical protein